MRSVQLYFIPLFVLAIASCERPATEDQKFERLANNYIERFLEMQPEWATSLGDHRYDTRMNDYSIQGIEATRKINQAYLDSLGRIDPKLLSKGNGIDFKIMRSNLQSWIFSIDTLKEHEWNPLAYNPGGAIYSLLARDFAPLRDRLLNLKERLKMLPDVLEAAKSNLRNPPQVHTETAILQNKGNISLVRDELKSFLSEIPELQEDFLPIQQQATSALEEYGVWLENDLLPRSTGEFRIGAEKYQRKLYYTLESDLTKEEILAGAQADLKATQDKMYQTALPLYRKFFPNPGAGRKLDDKTHVIKSVLDKLAEDRPDNETIVGRAKQYVDSVTAFAKLHQLMTVPDEPIKVIVMPEFQRGVAVAYCDAAGPLEKNGETFYAISPTPADWPKERVLSFFREYNNHMLQDLTIHEATPGHYLQLSHANKFKAPTMIRAIFSSGTFIEGWATYAEQLMVEKGYGGPEVAMQQLKMRLRLIINAIIDQKIHTAGMTEKEAVNLMMQEGFQEEGEATGKWRRACLTSAQLSTYYVGNTEVNAIRKAYEAKRAGTITMREMHDRILSFGSPAPKYIIELLDL